MSKVNDLASKNLLLLTYWYPPSVGAAAERMRSFAAYLPAHGWRVNVICAERGSAGGVSEANNNTTVSEDGVSVNRVADPLASEGPVFADYDPRAPKTPAWKRLIRRFVFPDRFVRWRKVAAWRAIELSASTRFDAILATFPPASVVQLGLEVHSATGSPLVLDFRDRWIGPGGYAPESECIRHRHRALEQLAIRKAAAVIAVSENMANAIAEENGIDRARVHVIPNGYEPIADWEASSDADDTGAAANANGCELVISHVGTVISRNRPEVFLDSLRSLNEDSMLGDVRFRFVGNLSRDYIRSAGLEGLVESTGLVDRETARREMRDADALLLLVGDYVGRWGHNAKLFEYVQAGRPILCLEESPGSNDRRLLEEFVAGRSFFAPLGDGQALIDALSQIRGYAAQRPAAALELRQGFRAFSRRELATSLAEVLNRYS